MAKERPILIALISILEMLSGLLVIAAGVLLMMGMLNDVDTEELQDLKDIAGIVGGGVLIFGIITFGIGYGMFKGWRIMWYLGVIFNILDVVFGIISLTFVTAIISAIILYYLFRPKVKTFFSV
ncbi:MAG: hypothetical protein MJZ21_05310 [archaeon]|nr:hypothetical protein [archaeon]